MDTRLQIILIVGTLFWGGIIVYLLKKGKVYIKYSLIWLLTVIVLLLLAIFPKPVGYVAHLIGMKTTVNFIYVVGGAFVLCILLICTVIVSHMNSRIVKLVQTQGILEKRIRDLEKEILNEKKER